MNIILSEEPILEVDCVEKGQPFTRRVYPTRLDLERMKFLWDKLKNFDTLFNDFVRGNFQAFIEHFIIQVGDEIQSAGLMWDVDDVGMFVMNDIRPCASASGHFLFWDRRFSGREDLCRKMVEFVMEKYNLVRLEIRVPVYSNHTMKAVERIGFTKEGRLRDAILYKDHWFDVNIYSVISREMKTFMETSNGS